MSRASVRPAAVPPHPTELTTPRYAVRSNGDSAFRVIPWIVIDPSATGTGTSASAQFGTYDATAANGFRPLIASSETTTAFTASPHLGSGMPITATSLIAACW